MKKNKKKKNKTANRSAGRRSKKKMVKRTIKRKNNARKNRKKVFKKKTHKKVFRIKKNLSANKKIRQKNAHKRVPVYKNEGGSIFEVLFGAMPKVRLIQLFFRNEIVSFSVMELADRTKLDAHIINKECNALVVAGLLVGHGSGSGRSYKLNLSFPFLAEFKNLIQRSFPVEKSKLISIVKRAGKLRLVLVSGLFLNRDDSPVDIFIIADKLSEKRLAGAIADMETLIGKELRWAGMETQEFLYRWRMFDRFVHDLLAAPHEKIYINKLNLV